ncbi:hypothetical protein [Streptomyces sp. AS02]|uniref:hypothetical protein n=1 Tax=Streptomyces sp. AS02 TaxID=2938946 RepID=UPI002021546D|nr:hypothetical protein [Streptomyces sp. AS02]MCL8016179.1 hypothetical protein [Streptomyces sp. AS02]
MFQRVGTEYEDTVMEVMATHRETGTAPEGALRALCDAYIACTLENGALHADIGAALVASGEPPAPCTPTTQNGTALWWASCSASISAPRAP